MCFYRSRFLLRCNFSNFSSRFKTVEQKMMGHVKLVPRLWPNGSCLVSAFLTFHRDAAHLNNCMTNLFTGLVYSKLHSLAPFWRKIKTIPHSSCLKNTIERLKEKRKFVFTRKDSGCRHVIARLATLSDATYTIGQKVPFQAMKWCPMWLWIHLFSD